jgi:hypothetical protein
MMTMARFSSPIVVWLRCMQCHRGSFAAAPPSPQPCPACRGGQLRPVARWDLRREAAPSGMLWCEEGRV